MKFHETSRSERPRGYHPWKIGMFVPAALLITRSRNQRISLASLFQGPRPTIGRRKRGKEEGRGAGLSCATNPKDSRALGGQKGEGERTEPTLQGDLAKTKALKLRNHKKGKEEKTNFYPPESYKGRPDKEESSSKFHLKTFAVSSITIDKRRSPTREAFGTSGLLSNICFNNGANLIKKIHKGF